MLLPLTLFLAIAPLTVHITDENDRPTPARVYLTDSQGQPVAPPLDSLVFDKTNESTREAHFVPQTGAFTVALAPGVYRLAVERGKEYLPHAESITIPRARPVLVRLQRWVDMKARGWYSADMHVHRPLAELATLMAAEDLPIAIPITRWRTLREANEDPSLPRFLAAAPSDGIQHFPNGFFPILNEELEPRASALLASFLGRKAAPLDYPLSHFAQVVRAEGGLVDSEKPTSLELPALAAQGQVQFIGLANNHLWRSGAYLRPWGAWPDRMPTPSLATCEGFVRSGWDMYATLVNAGIPVRLSAGTASGVHPVPLGWSRVYVQSRLDPPSWKQALLTGNTFVTTGPMLMLQVAGATASVEMLSPDPVTSVELVVNGEPRTLSLTRSAAFAYHGSVTLPMKRTSWVAARWLAATQHGCNTAHTSAVWIYVDDKHFQRSPEAVGQLERLVRNLLNGVKQGLFAESVMTDTQAIRQQTLDYLADAENHYKRMNPR